LKELIFFLKDHFINYSRKSFLVSLILFLGLNITIFYSFDIGPILLHISKNPFKYTGVYFLIYAYGYYTTLFWYGYIYKNPSVLSIKMLTTSFFLLVILAMDKAVPIHKHLSEIFISYPFVQYLSRVFSLLLLPLTLFLVIIILIWINNLNRKSLGLSIKALNVRPFIYIFMTIIPVVAIASFNQGFQEYYPLYKPTLASEITSIPDYIFVGIYEFVYGLNLLSIEIIFRGILVIGFIRFIGKGSVFPMITFYCFIHFDKPVMECISSIFGGYLLGIIALYTRSIMGGSILHIGMAWLMELMAWIQQVID